MSSITTVFEKKINSFKKMLYDNIILFDQTHSAGDLAPLNNYKKCLFDIFHYWSGDLYYNYPNIVKPTFLMPNHKIQQAFIQLTDWYITYVLKTNDPDIRTDCIAIIQRECEREPLDLN